MSAVGAFDKASFYCDELFAVLYTEYACLLARLPETERVEPAMKSVWEKKGDVVHAFK